MKFEIELNIADIKYNIKFLYDTDYLTVKIREQNDRNKKYKDIRIKFGNNREGNVTFAQFHKIITNLKNLKSNDKKSIDDLIKIYKEANKNKLRICLKNDKKEENNVIEIETYLLNIKYYLTTGPDNKRKNEEPFYSYLENENFKLSDIEKLIKKEKLDEIYEFDSYKMQNENGFYEKIGYENYKINFELILELHYKNTKKLQPIDMEKYSSDILDLKKSINNISGNAIDYDIIYLYSSPIIENGKELNKPISYREEMEIIINIMKKKGKKFNCLFECMDYEVLRDALMNKRTKVLHISSHGLIDIKKKNERDVEYNLIVENLKNYGETQKITEDQLKNTIKHSSHNIKNMEAIILSTCHSGGLKEIFEEYNPKKIIYIDKYTEIGDFTSVKFTKYFYEELFEGHSIQECYETSIKKLKCDINILSYGIDRCCCYHFHDNQCKEGSYHKKTSELKKKEFHKKFHNNCNCKKEENHTHNKDCTLIPSILKKKEEGYKVEELNNEFKICCCNCDITHNEILKFKFSGFEKKNLDDNDKEKLKGINLFKYNIKGEININKNVCVDFMASKYKSIIGRKKCVQEIFKCISENKNKCIVLYGQKGLRKRNFAESVCVYLIERKIIDKHEIYILESGMDYKNMKNKIESYEKQNSNERSVKIIKFIDIENLARLNQEIIKIKTYFKDYQNLYFMILYDLDDNQDNFNDKDKFNDVRYLNAKIENPFFVINYFYQLYTSSYKEIGDGLKIELNKIYTKPNQLEELSKKLIFGKLTEEEAIKKIQEKRFEEVFFREPKIVIEITEENKDICSLYYILSKFPSGLPNNLIKNIFGQLDSDPENLIKENQKNSWKYIDKNIIFKSKNDKNVDMVYFTKEYIIKFLKHYTALLDSYIDLNRNIVNFKDDNIHILFNSYNNSNLWKSNIKETLKRENDFGETCLFYESNDIIEHSKNISNLISLIINNLEYFISNDYSVEKYIEEILLLFPSILFFKKQCNETIKICIHFCEKCIKFKKDKLEDPLHFERLKIKLLLYQFSIGETEKTINLGSLINEKYNENKNFSDLVSEYKYINFFKNLETIQKNELKNLENIKDVENKKKMSLLYYEFSKKFFIEKNIEESAKYINKAIIYLLLYIQKDYNIDINENNKIIFNEFINKWNLNKIDKNEFALEIKYLFRMIIDSCQVFKLLTINKRDEEKIDEKIKYLNLVLLDKYDSDLYNEAYYIKTELYNLKQPDIVMLNSNPIKNQYGILSSGIYAYLNNQYYILKNLVENKNNEIESFIRIKSLILNKENLENTLNEKGEILIIQSDDFSENGDIICESDDGKSELLTKDEFIKISPSKISFKVIILCFKNSYKLVESFKNINYDYIISFEYFDFFNYDNKTLIEYNKLCIDFIIDFIKLSSKDYRIRNIFNEAKNKFLKNDILNKISNKEFIYLTQNETDFGQNIEYIEEKGEILLYESIPILNDNHEYKNYYLEINGLLEQINNNQYIKKNCCEKKKKRFIKIGYELIKYLFRHKIFSDYFDIDMKKINIDTLKTMIDENANKKKKNFYLIYNCNENTIKNIIKKKEKNNYYFIIFDLEHENGSCDSEIDSDSEINNKFDSVENGKFSIFNNNLQKKYDESSSESIEGE